MRQSKLLLLDEASFALDAVSERVVQEGLKSARRGHTTIIIAHRLSSVRAADPIAVLERGKFVELRTHDELLAKNGM